MLKMTDPLHTASDHANASSHLPSEPTKPDPAPSALTTYRRWDWRDFGLCVAAAGVLLWVAHFALAWDRVLVGSVFLAIGFGLGHWLGRRSAGGDDTGGLVHGRWGYRVFLLGLVLAIAAVFELAGYSFMYWSPVAVDETPRFESFPWRPFVAGGLGLVLGVLLSVFGWRSSKARIEPASAKSDAE